MDDALKKLGYDPRLRKVDSIAQRSRGFVTALSDNIRQEPTPFAPRTIISKGTIETTGGGLVQLFDTTGGTLIFTYDPDTGAITLNGALVNISVLNAGTIKSSTFAGTFTNNSLSNGGTYNNGVFGTPSIVGGTYSNAVLTIPSLTGGTYNQAILGSPTITTGTITDKLTVLAGANKSIGKGTLAAGIATISTTIAGVASNIFLTPISSGANLGILSVGTINAGTNFVVNSSNILDTDSFNWWVIN